MSQSLGIGLRLLVREGNIVTSLRLGDTLTVPGYDRVYRSLVVMLQ